MFLIQRLNLHIIFIFNVQIHPSVFIIGFKGGSQFQNLLVGPRYLWFIPKWGIFVKFAKLCAARDEVSKSFIL